MRQGLLLHGQGQYPLIAGRASQYVFEAVHACTLKLCPSNKVTVHLLAAVTEEAELGHDAVGGQRQRPRRRR